MTNHLPNHLYDALFAPHVRQEKPFLVSAHGAAMSYATFLKQAARFANVLQSLGVKPGDRVAVQLEKSQDALALYAACVQAGAVYLPLNTAYTAAEVTYFVEDAEPGLVVADPAAVEALKTIAANSGARIETLGADGTGTLLERAAAMPERYDTVARTQHDTAAILYTSGTTGRSKGAVLSHENLLSNALALKAIWRFTPDDVLLHALPIFHVHGLFVATNVILAAGASMIFLPKFDASEMIRLMPGATAMMGVPTFYTRLLSHADFTKETAQSIRLFISGSAPLLPQTFAEFEERTGQRILERYGMTETGMIASNPYDGERRAGSVGFPLPGVSVRIANPECGDVLAQGETGVIEVSGPNVLPGYWKKPELRRTEFRADGFFITGDLGTIDRDGYVNIVGRAKDLIISGGLNVYPKEIETLIDSIEGVVESAVFGLPHPDFGEAVAASVVVAIGSTLDAETIKAALRDKLANFKQPKAIFVVEDLPRNTMGKVQKSVLREQQKLYFA